MFNFSNLSNTSFSSAAGQHLKPYEIHHVNLTKIEKTELKGSKDPNASYPIIAIEFTGCDDSVGTFTSNLFIPVTEEDMTRPKFSNAEGHEYERPSRFENFQFTLMQLVHVLNPIGEEKIKENASKIKTIDQFIELIIKALKGKETVKTSLKLVGRNNNGSVYATLPNACGLNKDGEIFPINFIGDNLFFTNYELSQMKKYQNSTPTKMDNAPAEENENLDLEGIELSS